MTTALVIGAGPAGLMAAETLAVTGVSVTIADRMPSVGRKFLMAGKSGLNLTKSEPIQRFQKAFQPAHEMMRDAIAAFGPEDVQEWARELDQEVFTGSTGRVFPNVMKASPLLRAMLNRFGEQGVKIETRWTWGGWDGAGVCFQTPDGAVSVTPDIVILALGGASWKRLGSDGAWTQHIPDTAGFKPANIGFRRKWSAHITPFIGQPIKGIALQAGDMRSRGEIVLSAEGIEGGGIYEVSLAVRDGAALRIDLTPDIALETLRKRWSSQRSKATLGHFLKSTLRFGPAKRALFNEVLQSDLDKGVADPIALLKALPVSHDGPRKMDEAISTAGGVRFAQLDQNFMLRGRPGVFCAGEMLDWEAPTGGYLITGCLATGRAAARGALAWVA